MSSRAEVHPLAQSQTQTATLLRTWGNLQLRLLCGGIVTGAVVGVLVVAFRVVLEQAEALRNMFFLWARSETALGWAYVLLVVVGSAAVAGWLTRFAPEAAGSGVPHIQAVLLEQSRLRWWRVIPIKFLASVLAIGTGFSLGSEGPSVQIGAAGGQATTWFLKRSPVEERYLITCGSGAGLAAAFNAPLTGVMFVLEELRRNFSPYVFLSGLAASIAAGTVAQRLLGLRPLLALPDVLPLPPQTLLLFVLVGLGTGLVGALFNRGLGHMLDLYARIKIVPRWLHPVLAAVPVALVGYFITPAVLGGGHGLIEHILSGEILSKTIPLLLLTKFVLTIVSSASGVPGGIYIPLLSLGTLSGALLGQLAAPLFPGIAHLAAVCAVAGMVAAFTAIIRAPLTGIVLVLEITGNYSNMIFYLVASLVAYLVAEGLKVLPITEMLLERDLASGTGATGGGGMTLVELAVESGSAFDRRAVKEVALPRECLLVSIRRGTDELLPRGDTLLRAGDHIACLLPRQRATQVLLSLKEKVQCQPK